MNRTRALFVFFGFGTLFGFLALPFQALGTPNGNLDSAIQTGEFGQYLNDTSAWLNEQVKGKSSQVDLGTLIEDPTFRQTLDQWQLLSKTGASAVGAFAKADPANKMFLGWLLNNTTAMDLYLEAAVPIGPSDREKNTYKLNTAALVIWKNIFNSDSDSKDGLCLKLAIATALAPPGSVNIGAGGAKLPEDPVVRYTYYKTAHQNKELFPSFDNLTVWEYTRIVSSGASDEDLTWAREMINTFRPDLRIDEQVVNSTSLVWRRRAPAIFYPPGIGFGNFKNVLAGGGECGPRSSWAQMICQAFGIPAIGVGQPGHACVAYKTAYPMNEPQSGHAWKVDYGRGWAVSKLMGLNGSDFLAGFEKRSDPVKFSTVEHLRWLAGALTDANQTAAVMTVAHQIDASITNVAGEEKVAGMRVMPVKPSGSGKLDAPITAVDGVIHVEADAFFDTGGRIAWGGESPNVLVHDSFTGGKQVYFQQQMREQWADYAINVPAAGNYELTMNAACINEGQILEIVSGQTTLASVDIPLNFGLWAETKPVMVKLDQGVQTLRIQVPKSVAFEHLERGIALRSFELKPNSVRARTDVEQGRLTRDLTVRATHDIQLKAGQTVSILKKDGGTMVVGVTLADGSTGTIFQTDAASVELNTPCAKCGRLTRLGNQ